MKLIVVNPSSDNLSYVSGLVTVSSYNSAEVAPGLWVRLYADLGFLSDLRNSNLLLSDGVTTYRYPQTETLVRDAIDRINFSPVKKDFSFSSSQTNTALWTPTSGKKFVITDYVLSMRNGTLGAITVTIFDDSNSTGNILYKSTVESGANFDTSKNFTTPFVSSALNRVLKITTSGGITISGTVQGYESE